MCFLRATNSAMGLLFQTAQKQNKLHSDFKKHVAQTTDRKRATKSQVYNYTTNIQIRWRYKHIEEYFFAVLCANISCIILMSSWFWRALERRGLGIKITQTYSRVWLIKRGSQSSYFSYWPYKLDLSFPYSVFRFTRLA